MVSLLSSAESLDHGQETRPRRKQQVQLLIDNEYNAPKMLNVNTGYTQSNDATVQFMRRNNDLFYFRFKSLFIS